MARFGELYLNNGYLNGQQILPADWIKESTQSYSEDASWFENDFEDCGYGYQWWLAQVGGYSVTFALGHGGQFIVIVPELDMVIVATSKWQVGSERSGTQINSVLNLIANSILAPVRDHFGQSP
jgi:CubicO group peptidase (beta-lactamase class C family)